MPTIDKALRNARMQSRMTIPEMAKALNVSATTIVNYESGKRLPDIDFLLDLSTICEMDFLYWLGLRVAASHSPLASSAKALLDAARGSPVVKAGQSFVSLPLYAIQDVSQPNKNSTESLTTDELPQFSTAWIKRELNATPADLCLVPVEDDSMTPTLRPGDTVLLDLRAVRAEREGIYVIRMNGVSLFKRLQLLPDGIIKVSSDNQAYETFTVSMADIHSQNFNIVGRVVWVVWAGRRI